MKKILSTLLLLLSFAIQAQNTGIGTTNPKPSAILELNATDKALLVTRVESPMMVNNPVNGMIIYDNSAKCFRVYQGGLGDGATDNGAWSQCYGVPNPPLPPAVGGLGCSNATVSPSSALYQVSYTGTVTLPYYQGNGASYPTQLVNSTGVTGLTAQLLPGTLNGTPQTTADGNLYFTVSGTPTSTGNANFAFTFGGKSCTFSISVNYPAAVASTDCAGRTVTGTLTAGTAASGVSVSVPYTSGNGGYYNAISISSVGVTGLTATAAAGFVNNGNGNVVLNIGGTPNTSGNATFNLNFAGTSCQVTIPVGAGGPQVATFTCGSTTYTPGNIYAGTSYNGTATIPYTGGNGQTYTAGAGVPSTGVTGLTATLQPGTLANGSGNLTYTISGTPNAAGTATFNLSFGGQSCTLTATVTSTPATLPAGTGTFGGKTCFDIAQSNDNINSCGTLASRLPQKADFTQAATHTQSYVFTPSGTVSNVRFIYVNTNGNVVTAISGNNTGNNISTPVTATVNYNTNLNTLALGLTNSNPLTVDIYVVYNDNANNTGTERQIKLTAEVKDCNCCGAWAFVADTESQPATNPKVWLNFMCHNLGADQTLDPFTWNNSKGDLDGSDIKGDLYQWGRRTDGHEKRNSPVQNGFSSSATPNTNVFYANGGYNWYTGTSPNFAVLWGDGTMNRNQAKAANDPCPVGYKVPSILLLGALYRGGLNNGSTYGDASYATANKWTWTGSGYKIGDRLYLPVAGYRNEQGYVSPGQSYGFYWSSSTYTAYRDVASSNIAFSSGFINFNNTQQKSYGLSVRCVTE